MIIYWRDVASTWEVDTAFKPSAVLFSSFLGSIAPDMIIYWRLFILRLWKSLNKSGCQGTTIVLRWM
nr:hypothetical protein CFP56_57372 [Quercus suber]